MELDLKGKVILVTGGASGIGEAIARGLVWEGAKPIILDRDAERGEEIAKDVGCDFHPCDLTFENGVKSTVDNVLKKHSGIDGVVNNAGINDNVGLDASPDDFRGSLEKNIVQCFTLIHFTAEALRKSRGAIVNIGSKVARTGQGGTSGYAAAKGGLAALTREWALDFASDNVRVNAVVPAEVWTPMYESWLSTQPAPAGLKEKVEKRIPLGERMTTPEEIATTAIFLLSPRSSHTTGQLVFVDGGYSHLDRAYP